MTGLSEQEFYNKYPDQQSFMMEYGGMVEEYKKGGWIQKATASIKKRGTEGVCTGSNFGGPSCRPGTKRYALAKTFRKMAKARKKEEGGYVDMYEDGGKLPEGVLRSRLEAHMSPAEAQDYINNYAEGGVVDVYQLMGMPTPSMYGMGGYAMGGPVNIPNGYQKNITFAMGGETQGKAMSLKDKYNLWLNAKPVTKYASGGMPPHPEVGMNPLGNVPTKSGGIINVEKKETLWKVGKEQFVGTKRRTEDMLKKYNERDKLALASEFNSTERDKAKKEAEDQQKAAIQEQKATKAMTRMMGKYGGTIQRMMARGGMIGKFANGGDPFDLGNLPLMENINDPSRGALSNPNLFPRYDFQSWSNAQSPMVTVPDVNYVPSIFPNAPDYKDPNALTNPMLGISNDLNRMRSAADANIAASTPSYVTPGTRNPASYYLGNIPQGTQVGRAPSLFGSFPSDSDFLGLREQGFTQDDINEVHKTFAEATPKPNQMGMGLGSPYGAFPDQSPYRVEPSENWGATPPTSPVLNFGNYLGNMNQQAVNNLNAQRASNRDVTVPTIYRQGMDADGRPVSINPNMPSGYIPEGKQTMSGSGFNPSGMFRERTLAYAPAIWNAIQAMKKPTKVPKNLGRMSTDFNAPKISDDATLRQIEKEGALGAYNARQLGGSNVLAGLTNLANSRMSAKARTMEELRNKQAMLDYQAAAQRKNYEQYNAQQDVNRYMLQAQADDVPTQYASKAFENLGDIGSQAYRMKLFKELYG